MRAVIQIAAQVLLLAGMLYGQMYDLLLKGGPVTDPKQHLNAARDVAIRSGKIAVIALGIPDSQARKTTRVARFYTGFDLVAFSGGKTLQGPQCSGLLLGRKDPIEAGIPAISPTEGIGRAMKVGKEEIAGLLAAVERYLKVDHAREYAELEGRASEIVAALSNTKGLKVRQFVPEIAHHVPHVDLTWPAERFPMSATAVAKQLIEGKPSIAVSHSGERHLRVSVWTVRPGEHRVVARRLREIFAKT